jgi:cation transport ATPase
MKNLAKILGVGLIALALPFAALAGSAKAKNLNLDVTGMQTATSEAKVHDALAAIESVEVKRVDARTGTVLVSIDPEKVSPEAILSAISAAGFEAKVSADAKTDTKAKG